MSDFHMALCEVKEVLLKEAMKVDHETMALIASNVQLANAAKSISAAVDRFDHHICVGLSMAEKEHGALSAIGAAIADAINQHGE